MAEIKPIYGTDRVKLAEVVPLDTPFSVFVFPTTYCNFKCIYCAHSLGYEEMKKKYGFVRENMTLSTYKNVIQKLKEFPKKIKMLSLTGQGEPLLNKDIAKMVELAKKEDVAERIEIISNGALLNNKMSDALISVGLDTLRISVQGLSAKKYKEVCGANIDFEEYINNIKYFYSKKNKTKLFVKIMDIALENNEEKKFYDIFGNCCDRMYIEKMLPAYDGVKLTDGMVIETDRYGRKNNKREVCPLAFYMLGIFPNGDVEPCDTIYKPIILGNINTDSFLNIWNSSKLKSFWKMQLEGKRYDNPKCAVCTAPDDVAHPEDVLDEYIDMIKKRI